MLAQASSPRSKVLVTGAAGFVGRRLVALLERHGHEVIGLDLCSGATHVGDVCDRAAVRALVPEGGIVLHLASVVGVVEVLRRPAETWRVCVEGTRQVCAAALERGARVVLTSSSEVYGAGRRQTESARLPVSYGGGGRAAYPLGKREAEAIVRRFCARGGDGRVARLFNVSGPGQRAATGMVLPTFVENALRARPLPIVGDGTDVRCFQHVDDAAEALERLAFVERATARTINLGSDDPITVRALAARVLHLLGVDVPLRPVTSRQRYGADAGRCRCRVPDTRLALQLLGYRPRRGLDRIVTDLAQTMSSPTPCVESPVTRAS